MLCAWSSTSWHFLELIMASSLLVHVSSVMNWRFCVLRPCEQELPSRIRVSCSWRGRLTQITPRDFGILCILLTLKWVFSWRMPYSGVWRSCKNRRFGGTISSRRASIATYRWRCSWLFDSCHPDDWGGMFLRNVGSYTIIMASHPGWRHSSKSLPRKPQISHSINRLGSVAETYCVSCEVRTGILYPRRRQSS
jgi:hypothetical protein